MFSRRLQCPGKKYFLYNEVVFILYLNFINIMESWITEGRWHWWSGLIALHGSVLLLTAFLFIRRIWLQRWLPRELTIGYWRDRME